MKHFFNVLIIIIVKILVVSCSLPPAETIEQKIDAKVSLISVDLVEYTATLAKINIKGTLPSAGTTLDNRVTIHLSSSCKDSYVGVGSARSFKNEGLFAQVPTSGTITTSGTLTGLTRIYISTNTLSECMYLTDYTFEPGSVLPADYSNTSPQSPSRTTNLPLIFGHAITNSTVNFYKSSSCSPSDLVGSGSSAVYASTGIRLTLPLSTTTQIYAQVVDSRNEKSICRYLTDYTHATDVPLAPIFSSIAPLSPNNVTSSPAIRGTTSGTTIVGIKFYKDAACLNEVGYGTPSDLISNAGISLQLPTNQTISIFARSIDDRNISSDCAYMTSYLYDNIPPQSPSYLAANPASPTRLTIYPKIFGLASQDAAAVRLYNSPTCLSTSLIGSGAKGDFETGVGITANLEMNSINSIYATNLDAAGNSSNCTFLTYYKHNIIPPDPPSLDFTTPTSPNNITHQPKLFGVASPTSRNIYFFSDETCGATFAIGSGPANEFQTTGITVTTTNIPNSINRTNIYAYADDPEGNTSECVSMLNYEYSTALAPDPIFANFLPASPNNLSTSPLVFGSADASITKVSLYSDSSCEITYRLGSASRSAFITQGISVSLIANTRSNIYAQSEDKFGNTSDCILLAQYIHDNKTPISPVYVSSNPSSPTNLNDLPLIKGLAQTNDVTKTTQINSIIFYDDLTCLNQIGSGPITNFITGSGVEASVQFNFINTVYSQARDAAGNKSNCTFLLNYSHGNRSPGKPTLVSFSPASPSYSRKTNIKGTIASTTSIFSPYIVKVYKDNLCTQLIKSGSASDYTTAGIELTVDNNATTPIYAQVEDIVGNKSTCQIQGSFIHNNLGPQGLQLTQNANGSVLVQWQPDTIANPNPKYAVKRSLKSSGPYSIVAWDLPSNTYVDNNVSNGKTYYYVISAYNNTGNSLNSSEAQITVNSSLTSLPISLSALSQNQSIILNWTALTGTQNLYYKIFRSMQDGGPYTLIKDKVYSLSYTDLNLTNSQNYYYVVAAVNAAETSLFSNQASAVPLGIPNAPSELKANLIKSSPACGGGPAVYLKWSRPQYYSQFNIRRGYNSGFGTLVPLGAPLTTNEYYDCSPDQFAYLYPNGRNIFYTVESVWGSGSQSINSTLSNEVVIFNNNNMSLVAYPGDGKVYLDLTSVNLVATGYQIWRSTLPPRLNDFGWKNEGYVQIQSNYIGLNYLDTGLTNGQTYYYIAIPNNSGAEGWRSNVVQVVPRIDSAGQSISQLTVYQSPSGNTPILSWSPSSYFNYFNIYKSINGGSYQIANPSIITTNFYNDAIMTNGSMNTYKVVPFWGGLALTESNTVSYRYGVAGSFAAAVSSTSVSLSWSSVTSATAYDIYRSNQSQSNFTLLDSTVSSTYTHSTTHPVSSPVITGQAYFYKVIPKFADGTYGQFSTEVSASIGLTSTDAVSGLSVVGVGAGSVDLAWGRLTGIPVNPIYRIFMSTSLGGVYSQVASATQTTATISSLSLNQTYYFKVTSASCTINCFSNTVSATTRATSIQSISPLVVNTLTGLKITIPVVSNVDHFEIYRSSDAINFSVLANANNLPPGATSFIDTSVVSGQIYYYKIAAVFTSPNLTVFSKNSSGLTAGLRPFAPTGVYLTQLVDPGFSGPGTIDATIAWEAVPNATSYNIYWGTAAGVYTSSQTTSVLSSLTPGVRYFVAIKSVNGEIESSSFSPEFSFIPISVPSAPLVQASSATISISWSAIGGASAYDLLRSEDGVNFSIVQANIVGLSYIDPTPVSGKTYQYSYIPVHTSGIKMQQSVSSADVSIDKPLVPQNLVAQVKATAVGQVELSWTFVDQAGSNAISGYRIYRSTSSNNYSTALATVSQTQNSFSDSSIIAGQKYFYIVRSISPSGVESDHSNEAVINIISGPSSINTQHSNPNINVSWVTVPGASSYRVLRSQNSGGPYGLLGSTNTLNYTDSNITNGLTYYYVVRAVFADGSISMNSNESVITAIKTMNLRHAIELTDQPLSSNVIDTAFNRTLTNIDTTVYDGTISYNFEIVTSNLESTVQTIQLINSSETVVASIHVPALTTQPTRLNSGHLSLAAYDSYRIKILSSSNADSVKVFSAKIWVSQTNATKTKLYIPLLTSQNAVNNQDYGSPVESGQGTSWKVINTASIYQKNYAYLKNLTEFNSWDLETVIASTGPVGMIGLMNTTNQNIVDSSTTQFSNNDIRVVNTTFNDGDLNFTSLEDLNKYQVAYKCYSDCETGALNIYKAALWVELVNLTSIEIFLRNAQYVSSIANTSIVDQSRLFINLSDYTNPTVYFRLTAQDALSGASSGLFELGTFSGFDSGVGSFNAISSSSLSFSPSPVIVQQTSGPLSINSGDRFGVRFSLISGQFNLIDSFVIVRLSY